MTDSGRSDELVKAYGSKMQFLQEFNPSRQVAVSGLGVDAFSDDFPPLGMVRRSYDERVALTWLSIQLQDLCRYAGVREKLAVEQNMHLAEVILSTYGYLSVAELMVFFNKLKAGAYGVFYGVVDPMKITTALREFTEYRNEMKGRYYGEQKRKRDLATRKAYMAELEKAKRKGYNSVYEMSAAEGGYSKEQVEMAKAMGIL